MAMRFATRVLPDAQRRTLEQLTEELDLTAGDTRSKQSAFWTMLTLSAFIASAGVLADSTATVIGAMIIAPLSTPIMAIALGVAKRTTGGVRRAMRFAFAGALLVILVGFGFALVLPGTFDLVGNGQIAGRTSPGLLDLVAAVATGFAGAVALARRDVAAVLPGVAIAISLVPPLAVVGVCLGQGAVGLAIGALLLFASNLLALVLAGTFVFTVLGYSGEARQGEGPRVSRRRAYLTIGILLAVVGLPLVGNTVANYLLSVWASRVQDTAEMWISDTRGASIQGVDVVSADVYVRVRTPGELPPVEDLIADLAGQIPNGISIVVSTSLGERIDAGTVGEN